MERSFRPNRQPLYSLMQNRDFDVVIVGGGPAGSVAGSYLARGGLRVLIAEKDRFPRFKIGESLLPAGNAILQEIGVWEKIERAGFQQKFGAEFYVGNNSVPSKIVEFSQGMMPGLDYTYQVERARFDHLLLDHAASLGCEVRQGTKVTAAQEVDGGYEATISPANGQGEPQTVRCTWMIDASGRENHFAKPLKLNRTEPILAKRMAIYAHFRGVRRSEGKAAGNIVIVRHGEGWFWLIPLDAERTSVGLVTSAERMRAAGRKPEELFGDIIGESVKLGELMEGAEPVSKFHVTSDYSYRAKRFAGPRLLLVGDAAGFLDPMFSTGVFIALLSAKLASGEILSANRRGAALSPWRQWRYTHTLGRHLRAFEKLVLAFYDNASYSVFMDRTPPLELARAINSIVAGNALPPWPVRWRYWVFLLVCKLQRRWPLVPSIDLAPGAVIAVGEMPKPSRASVRKQQAALKP
jgi:flavin-dependent dehydrogenase